MPTPLVAPSPFGRENELIGIQQGALNNLAQQNQAYSDLVGTVAEQKAKIGTALINNAGQMADVFGGMQTGAGIENYLNLQALMGVQPTEYTGGMTGQLDQLRLADLQAGIAAKNRAGRGGGGGSSKPKQQFRIVYNDGRPPMIVDGKPSDMPHYILSDPNVESVQPTFAVPEGGGGADVSSSGAIYDPDLDVTIQPDGTITNGDTR